MNSLTSLGHGKGGGAGNASRYYQETTAADHREVGLAPYRDFQSSLMAQRSPDAFPRVPDNAHGTWVAYGPHAPRELHGQPAAQPDVARALSGVSPDGSGRAVQGAGKDKRALGQDATNSAPKGVSITQALGDERTRAAIEHAHRIANDAAMRYLAGEITSRRGKGGEVRERASIIVATYAQHIARPDANARGRGDPQLHSHNLIANLAYRRDGSVGTIESIHLYRAAHAAGAIYQCTLAHQLERAGLRVEAGTVRDTIRLRDVDPALERHFSKRSGDIRDYLRGNPYTQAAAHSAARATRGHHDLNAKEGSARERWLAELHQKPELQAAVARLPRVGQELLARAPYQPDERALDRIVDRAAVRITESQSVFSRNDLVREAMGTAAQWGASPAEVFRAIDRAEAAQRVVPLETAHTRGGELFSTPEMIKIEAQVMRDAQTLAERTGYAVPVREDLVRNLTADQRGAVAAATADCGIAVVEGDPGVGKSASISVIAQAYREAGYRVEGLAPTGRAAAELARAANIPVQTIASWQQTGAQFADRTVVVLDEAGMVSSRQFEPSHGAAVRDGAKVIAVGDRHQLQPIGAGQPFKHLRSEVGKHAPEATTMMRDIVRQADPALREVAKLAAQGKGDEALAKLDQMGRVHVYPTMDAACAAAAQAVIRSPEAAVILTPDRHGVRQAADAVRAARAEQQPMEPAPKILAHGPVGAVTFSPGDRVLFTANEYRDMGVRNGWTGTVTQVHANRDAMTVQLDPSFVPASRDGQPLTDSRTVEVNVERYKHLAPGEAMTGHKLQGGTVPDVHIVMHAGDRMIDQNWFTTAASRERTDLHLHLVGDRPASREPAFAERERPHWPPEAAREPAQVATEREQVQPAREAPPEATVMERSEPELPRDDPHHADVLEQAQQAVMREHAQGMTTDYPAAAEYLRGELERGPSPQEREELQPQGQAREHAVEPDSEREHGDEEREPGYDAEPELTEAGERHDEHEEQQQEQSLEAGS